MAISKVAYDGHTLIDLTGDTAVAADVLSGKTFHLADGTQAVGVNTGGITPTGTINITANGTHDVTSYASANVAVPGASGSINITANGSHDVTAYATANVNVPAGTATFGRTINIIITSNYYDETDYEIYYRGYDPDNTNNVIWRYTTLHTTDSTPVTTSITIAPATSAVAGLRDAFRYIEDGFYISANEDDVLTSITGGKDRFSTDDGHGGSDTVAKYVSVSANTVSLVYS